MTSRTWLDGESGNTPLTAQRLNGIEQDLDIRLQLFQPNTKYLAGQYVTAPDGQVVQARETFTSGGSYAPANWNRNALLLRSEADGLYLPASASILQSLRGTYAARPAATAVPNGSLYYAENVWEMYRSNGATWQVQGNGGNELGQAQLINQPVKTNGSVNWEDVPGMSVSFVAGERPVLMSFACEVACSTGQHVRVGFFLGASTTPLRELPRGCSVTNQWEALDGSWRSQPGTLTPGTTYVVKLMMKGSTGVTAGAPAYFGGGNAALRVVNL